MKLKNTLIKSLSLGTGMALSIILVAKICFELSYDRCYDNPDSIYLIRTGYSQQGHEIDYDQVSGAVAPGFRQYVPGVEYATRTTFLTDSDRFTDEDGNVLSGKLIIADTSYFDVFPAEILAGDPKSVLGEVAKAMVSRSFAEKLGGIHEAMNKMIENSEFPGYKVTVAGVFDDFPYQSSQKYDILLSMASYSKNSTDNWLGNDRYRAYVRLAEGVDYKMLAPAIRLMQEKNQPLDEIEKGGNEIWYYLTPLAKNHTSNDNIRNMLLILGIVALLMLVISLLNYILFTISSMVKRSKEIGVRKCYGAGASDIYGMMIREAAVDVALALGVASVLILSFQSTIGDLAGVPVSSLFVPRTVAVLSAVIACVFVVAAFVPARMYSAIPIASAIRNYRENKRLWKLSLLFVQICVCTFLVSLVFVIGKQYDKAINDKPGYEYDRLLYVSLRGSDISLHPALIGGLEGVPGVEDVQMSYDIPLAHSSGNNVSLPGDGRDLFNIADQYEGTEGLFDMLGIPFVEGRYPESSSEVAVSEGFVRKMSEFADWSDGAVGKQFAMTEHGEKTVCGVYRDYRIGTLTNMDDRASVKFYGKEGEDYMSILLVKVNVVNPDILDELNAVLDEFLPQMGLEFNVYSDSMRDTYSNERKMRNMVMSGSLICILIAVFGLVGYVREESERRSKEIAIRKINGAVTADILGLFVAEMTKLSAVAVLLADVGAFFAARVWLRNFSEKIALTPWYFFAADMIVLLLVIVTVVLNCLKISRSNPVESLKNE